MPIYLRRFYAKKLLDVKTKENEQVKAQQAKAKENRLHLVQDHHLGSRFST